VAEAGFYPGILLYFTYWFPAATRARILAIFCMGIPVSNIIGAPFSGWLLGMAGYGFKGWQWMYILEGIPTLALGFAALWCLPDNPRKAHFLTEREKDVVIFGIYSLGFWMPQMVKAMGYSIMETSLIVMIPYAASIAILWGIGISSDRTGKRALHFIISSLICAAGFLVAALAGGHSWVIIAGFCLAAGGAYSGLATFWSVPPLFLGGTAAAGAFALINCVGNLSGFVGPGLTGWLLQTTGSYTSGMWMCTGVALVAALSMVPLTKYCRTPPK